MLRLRPVSLVTARSIQTLPEGFCHKMIDNYSLLDLAISPAELLHALAAVKEQKEPDWRVLLPSVHMDVSVRLEQAINQFLNRLLALDTAHFTYQDCVYLTTVLSKLGITRAAQFIRWFRLLRQEQGSISSLLALYQDSTVLLHEAGLDIPLAQSRPGAEAGGPPALPRYYLYREIYSRLHTEQLYAILSSYQDHAGQISGGNLSLPLAQQHWVGQVLHLETLRQAFFSDSNISCHYFVNPYELNLLSPTADQGEALLPQACAAVLLSLAGSALSMVKERKTHWNVFSPAIGSIMEISLARFEQLHQDSQYVGVIQPDYLQLRTDLYQEEIRLLKQLNRTGASSKTGVFMQGSQDLQVKGPDRQSQGSSETVSQSPGINQNSAVTPYSLELNQDSAALFQNPETQQNTADLLRQPEAQQNTADLLRHPEAQQNAPDLFRRLKPNEERWRNVVSLPMQEELGKTPPLITSIHAEEQEKKVAQGRRAELDMVQPLEPGQADAEDKQTNPDTAIKPRDTASNKADSLAEWSQINSLTRKVLSAPPEKRGRRLRLNAAIPAQIAPPVKPAADGKLQAALIGSLSHLVYLEQQLLAWVQKPEHRDGNGVSQVLSSRSNSPAALETRDQFHGELLTTHPPIPSPSIQQPVLSGLQEPYCAPPTSPSLSSTFGHEDFAVRDSSDKTELQPETLTASQFVARARQRRAAEPVALSHTASSDRVSAPLSPSNQQVPPSIRDSQQGNAEPGSLGLLTALDQRDNAFIQSTQQTLYPPAVPSHHLADLLRTISYTPLQRQTALICVDHQQVHPLPTGQPSDAEAPLTTDQEAQAELHSYIISLDRQNRAARDALTPAFPQPVQRPDRLKTIQTALFSLDAPNTQAGDLPSGKAPMSIEPEEQPTHALQHDRMHQVQVQAQSVLKQVAHYQENTTLAGSSVYPVTPEALNHEINQLINADITQESAVQSLKRAPVPPQHHTAGKQESLSITGRTDILQSTQLGDCLALVHRQTAEEWLQALLSRNLPQSILQTATNPISPASLVQKLFPDAAQGTNTPPAPNSNELSVLLQNTIDRQMHSISDRVYREIEKRLQLERTRRGRF